MRSPTRRWAVWAVLAAAAAAPAARGEVRYEWADVAGTPVTAITIPGVTGTAQVRLYLVIPSNTLVDPVESPTLTLNDAGGLGSAGVRVTFAADGVLEPADEDDLTPGPAWAFGTKNNSNAPADLALNLGADIIAAEGVKPDTDGRVLLGVLTLQAAAVGSTTLVMADPNPGTEFPGTPFDTTTFFDPIYPLDTLIGNGMAGVSLSVTVAPVPEPTGFLLVAGCMATGAVARRRVRRGPGTHTGDRGAVRPG